MPNNKKSLGWFNDATTKIQAEVTAVMQQRGGEYCDSWGEGRFDNTWQAVKDCVSHWGLILIDAKARKIALRMVALSAMVDVKIARMGGGYKEDTFIDLNNYNLGLVEARREFSKIINPAD